MERHCTHHPIEAQGNGGIRGRSPRLEFLHSRRCPRSLESTEDVRQQEANERSEGAAGAERGAGAPASDGVRGSRGTKSPGQERAQRVSRRPEPPPRLRAARRSFSAKAGAAFALKRFGATKAERGEGAASTPARIKRVQGTPARERRRKRDEVPPDTADLDVSSTFHYAELLRQILELEGQAAGFRLR
jgi:hypothetical protein